VTKDGRQPQIATQGLASLPPKTTARIVVIIYLLRRRHNIALSIQEIW